MAAIDVTNPTPQSAQPAPARPRRSRRALFVRILGAFVVLGLLVFFLTPVVLSMDWARLKIERGISRELNAPVSLGKYSVGWFSGLEIGDLQIQNPRDFPVKGNMLRLKKAAFDFSLLSYGFGGDLAVTAKVNGLELRVHQLADGRTNVEPRTSFRVSRSRKYTGTGKRKDRYDDISTDFGFDSDGGLLADLDLDLAIENASIEVTDETLGVLESMRKIHASIRKAPSGLDLVVKLSAELHRTGEQVPGRVRMSADLDLANKRPWDFHLDTSGFDLSRYEPLLAWGLSASPFEKLQGVLSGNVDATVVYGERISMSGKLAIDKPHFKMLGEEGLDLSGRRFLIEPNVAMTLDGKKHVTPDRIDLSKFVVDLEFARITGMTSEQATKLAGKPAIGFHHTVDLARAANLGGPVPAQLRTAEGTATGHIILAPDWSSKTLWKDIEGDLLPHLRSLTDLNIKKFDYRGNTVHNVRGRLNVRGRQVVLTTSQGTLNGGTVLASLHTTLETGNQMPADISLSWQGGKVYADAVRVLRYVIPLFAGLDVDSKLDFDADINTTIKLSGPLLAKGKESILQWVNHWTGSGDLKLLNGGFSPAKQLGKLLTFAGEKNRLTFKDLITDFVIRQGAVETRLMKLNRKADTYGFRGKVYMDGRIDYRIALQDALKGHRDGEKARKYLGDTPLEATLSGTLEDPKLRMPDLRVYVQKALEKEAQGQLNKAIQKGLDKLFKRDKKKRKKDG